MLKVVEAFSGLGSQAKALENIGVEFEVLHTIDWDINAIFAYDILHNGPQTIKEKDFLGKDELVEILSTLGLSSDGKKPIEESALRRMRVETLNRIYAAIQRTNNLINIQTVTPSSFEEKIDILTYSFPCQDLSISGNWHGNEGGINRDANNRSSMLWEIERILFEMRNEGKRLPEYLLMENVTAIRSPKHEDNFQEWQRALEGLGYLNQVYDLSATDFGIPQIRKRTFMISVFVGKSKKINKLVEGYFESNRLDANPNLYKQNKKTKLKDYLKIDYTNAQYKKEALISNPKDTMSRKKIGKENPVIYKLKNSEFNEIVRTITTKQDRHPNSGIIEIDFNTPDRSPFRYLTPRENFLLMGFSEKDYNSLVKNNFNSRKNTDFLTRDKLNKLAGNSIVVDVLESVFLQILDIKEMIEDTLSINGINRK